jgi:uncharacterized membrane protein YccC
MSVARAVARESVRIDLARATPFAALVRALPVVALFAIGLAFHNPRSALTLGVGANLVAMLSLSGAARVRASLFALDVVGLGLATFVGSASASNEALHLGLLALWCFGAGILVLFGISPATAGVQSVIAFVVFGRFVDAPIPALGLAGFVMSGAAIEGAVLLLFHLPPTLGLQRSRLAAAFERLSALVNDASSAASVTSAESLEAATEVLNSSTLFGRSDVRSLRSLVDEGRRIRLELIALRGIRRRLSNVWSDEIAAAFEALMGAVAVSLSELATVINHPRNGLRAAAHVADISARIESFSARLGGDSEAIELQCAEHLSALAGQIRSAVRLMVSRGAVEAHEVGTRERRDFAVVLAAISGDVNLVRSSLHLGSSARRHAIRLALAVPGALLIADALGLPRAYWVAFSVAVVLKPDYSSLFRRGLGRVIGTMIGATLAALVVGGLHPGTLAIVALVGATAWLGYSLWQASFPVAIGFITALVLCMLSTTQVDTLSTAGDRLLDTVIGGLIALGIYVVWPTWSATGAYVALASLIRAQADYLDAVLRRVEGLSDPDESIVAKARLARLAWANAEAVIGRSVDEPAAHRIDADFGSGVLASARRLIESAHSLRVEAHRGIVVAPVESLERLRDGLCQALDRIAEELVADRPHAPFELRARFDQVARDLAGMGAPPSIALQLDEIVDAVNSLDALPARTRPIS